MKQFFKNNGLSIVFVFLFLISLVGQTYTGLSEYNKELTDAGAAAVSLTAYLSSGHFLQATFENWESEFLQMALFVWLTIFLKQKGSSESKKFDGTDQVDREPSTRRRNAPWPVKKGGVWLAMYKHSLGFALIVLYLASFALHFYGSLKDENVQHGLKHQPLETASAYIVDSRLWFESFQNWQSEFLSVFAIVGLSIYLREQGSAQSKPVDASHDQTGE